MKATKKGERLVLAHSLRNYSSWHGRMGTEALSEAVGTSGMTCDILVNQDAGSSMGFRGKLQPIQLPPPLLVSYLLQLRINLQTPHNSTIN